MNERTACHNFATGGTVVSQLNECNKARYTAMRRFIISIAGLIAAASFGLRADAAIIRFDVTPDVGSSWIYSYEVENDTGTDLIEQFTIFFDRSLFSNLAVDATPAGWEDAFVAQPENGPVLFDDGFFDVLAAPGFGIAPGALLGGFRVRFDFLGGGTPGSQAFDIIGADGFTPVFSGFTQGRVAVAEPGAAGLFGIALSLWAVSAFAMTRRRPARGARSLGLVAL